ncbi:MULTISPECIES: S-layer homology domain-containing protein [Trichocoleus]|uniref:S-layer homology domain-containing protein n=1 Tax=Trichocoleus desertorum GB2-A4 TaxID=2933944 RepID=A0ABV0J7C6_9CYAN|nr:S-layer homology domain-containing protein [Trichocoleus sp. FACHB-46]MBD1862634.1 S-layer homology domain-containing protein [Trichocoleus sp. FACHB-46]
MLRAVWQHWVQKETVSYVRTVATCTLLALVGAGLTPEAKADVVVPLASVPEPGSSVVSTNAADLVTTPAIAPPESASVTEFAATALPDAQLGWSSASVESAVTINDLVPAPDVTDKSVSVSDSQSAVVASEADRPETPVVAAQPKQLTAAEPTAITPSPKTRAETLRPELAPQRRESNPAIAPVSSSRSEYQVAQVSSFSDIQGHWAQSVIESLASRDVVRGFPDGTFRPDITVTRAQFSAIVRQAFQVQPVRTSVQFSDVSTNYWAYSAIDEAYRSGFVSASGNNVFLPDQGISRNQALVGLVNGLKLTSESTSADILETYFEDAAQVSTAERTDLAIATDKRLVVSYPNVRALNPQQLATRAEVAAFIYQALVQTGEVSALDASTTAAQYIAGAATTAETPTTSPAQTLPTTPTTAAAPSEETIQDLQTRLQAVQTESENFGNVFEGSPALSIANPVGFGADNGTGFISATYQERTRYGDKDDAAVGFGVGLGDARRNVGVELSYTLASFGGNRDFGTGGFNVKLHRAFSEDFAAALGWDGFITIGDEFNEDFKDSIYAVATKIFRTRPDLNTPFSRVALTGGIGNGRFRTEDDVFEDKDNFNVFGSLAVRVVRPVSALVEWTGEDLAAGLSIVPFKNQSLVITPAVRDIAGAGDGARFVVGLGYSWKF